MIKIFYMEEITYKDKGDILHIGDYKDGVFTGWVFANAKVGQEIKLVDGELYCEKVAGYTREELEEVYYNNLKK